MEGGEALSKGFVSGMTGIVTKPLEGAKSRGAVGANQHHSNLSVACQSKRPV